MQEILNHMLENNLNPGQPILDGKVHRFQADDKDKKKSGWYCGFQNYSATSGKPFYVVRYGNFRTGLTDQYQSSGAEYSKADMRAMREAMEKIKKQREEERKKVQEEVALECQESFKKTPTGISPYHTKKKLSKDYGAALADECAFIPMQDTTGKIWNAQKIQPDGGKFFQPGGRVEGCFHIIGTLGETIYIAEGFATAASIHEAIGQGVACAFNAGNLLPVAKALKEKYPESAFVICGDEDLFTIVRDKKENPGRDAAEKAAGACLGKAVFPIFQSLDGQPTDFNDLYVREGLEAIRQIIVPVKAEKHYIAALGHDDDKYYFVSNINQQIQRISASQLLSLAGLLRLQPLEYWEAVYPAEKGGIDKDRAANTLMSKCHERGRFNQDDIRGRGVWEDDGRVAYHRGTSVLIGNKSYGLHDKNLKTRFVYDLARELPPIHPDPLTIEECKILLDACRYVRWKQHENGIFLAGWLGVAMMGGALAWRPHVWITGPTGSGKSYILQNIVHPLIQNHSYYFRGATTEAGIRQKCGCSTLPVLFDEFETNDDHSAARIRSILELARQASSDSLGAVAKGTVTGNAIEFKPQFCMIVGSVRLNLVHVEDENRFAVLELGSPRAGEFDSFEQLNQCAMQLDETYGLRLFSRMISLADPLLESAEVFKEVLSGKYNMRVGQQYGSILAGYWMLMNDSAATAEKAQSLCDILNFDIAKAATERSDEIECLNHLLDKKVRVGAEERTIAEMISLSSEELFLHSDDLERIGIKLDYADAFGETYICIAVKHRELDELYRNSKWSGSYAGPLGRIRGALKCKSKWFTREKKNRKCVWVPLVEAFQ